MRKKPVRKLLVACITGALFLPKLGFTLGLGDIEVNSALNQELKADIELYSAVPEDAETLIVKLASREAFSRAGIDRPFLLNDLRFKTVVVDNVPHIQVTSARPVREPFLNFLLEVDWPKGHLLREYTILLDPPTFMTQSQAAPVQTNSQDAGFRPSAAPAAAVVNTAPATNFRPTARPTTLASAKNNSGVVTPSPVNNLVSNQYRADRYRIQSGDTAWSLAESMRPNSSVTVEQMMMALLQANPESFIDENINGLKRGYILRTPDLADITAISPAQARAMVKEQAALWRQYRQSHSGGSPVSAVDNNENSSAASEEASSKHSSLDKGAHLQIVSAGSGASTNGVKDPTAMSSAELREALAVARENLETERVEKELLNEKIDQLERQVDQSKGLLAVQGGELASAQAVDANVTPDTSGEMSDDASSSELSTDADTANADIEGMEAAGDSAAATDADSKEDAVFVDETGKGNAAKDVAMTQESSAEEDAAEPDTTEPAATQPAGIVNSQSTDPLTRLMNDPMLLMAAGGGLLLILALGYLIVKRRKSAADNAKSDEASTATSLDDIADMVEEDQQEDTEALDTESTMIMEAVDPNVDTVITDAFDEEEAYDEIVEEEEARDDVIAEADVYLAYGIYQQAEDLLENAISENPDRDDYRVKLAETHYASKNEAGFINAATELRNRHPDDDTAAWKKVAAMGIILCPDNALFQGGAAADVDVDALAPQSPEPMDIDLGLDEELDEELDIPDLDLSLDEADSGEANSVEMAEEGNDAILDIGDADDEADVFDVGSDDDVVNEDDADEEAAIDLDLDEVEFDLSETDAVAEDSTAEASTDEEFSLDIDASELDIDEDNDESESALDSASEDTSEADEAVEESTGTDGSDESIEIDIASADLDLDFGTDEEGAESVTDSDEQQKMNDELEIDISTDDDSLDIDFGVDDTAAVDASEDTHSTDDENSVELDVTEASDDEDAIDLDVVDLDLDTSDNNLVEESSETESDDVHEDVMDDDEFDLSSLDDVDEISTKLDLARAYLDMGDSEGTREILKEVLNDGSDEQKKEAEELMGQLDD